MKGRINSVLTDSVFYLALILFSESSLGDSIVKNSDISVMIELEMASNLDNGDTQKLELQIEPEIKVDFSNDWALTALGRIRGDAQDNINPNKRSKTELRELYFETEISETFFTMGKQQVVWGKADGLKVLDVVNPQDFREFILDDFDSSRIPLWAVNAEIPIDDSILQLIWIPDQTYNTLPDPNSIYVFTSPLIMPTAPPGVAVDLRPVEKPDRFFADADYAVRLISFISGWDVTLNYLYHYSDNPVLFRSLTLGPQPTVTVTPRYERSHLFGGTFSNAFDSFVLRGEVGYSTDRYYLSNNTSDPDGVIESDELAYVLGLDWSGIDETFLSAQLFQSRLVNDQPGLIRDKVDTTITLLARRDFMNDTLIAEVLWLQNLNNDDGLARPKISYEWNDEINVWAGLDVFYGNKKGLFGQFDRNDRLVIGVEWGI